MDKPYRIDEGWEINGFGNKVYLNRTTEYFEKEKIITTYFDKDGKIIEKKVYSEENNFEGENLK